MGWMCASRLHPPSPLPQDPMLTMEGPPHPPLQERPHQVLWPQLASRGHSPTPAQPEPPENNQGQPFPPSPSWRSPGPEKPPGFESWPQSAPKPHSLLLGTASHTSSCLRPQPCIPARSHRPPRKVHRARGPIAFPHGWPRVAGGSWAGGAELPA